MVYRYIEESLDLVSMEVACHHAVTSCRMEHVCNQLRSDGNSRLVLAVLSCPTEVRHDCDDLVGRCSLCCINHQKELEKIVGRRRGGLDDEYSRSTYAFVVARLEFTVAECEDIRTSHLNVEGFGNLQSEIL